MDTRCRTQLWVSETAAERGHVTRPVEVVLDPSPSQQRWLRSYVGSMRAAYNWALAEVRANLDVRRAERDRGVPEDELTPALSWSGFSLAKRWREVRDEVHPWHRDVSIHRHCINPDTREHVRLMLPRRAGDGTWERRHTRPRSQQAAGRDRRSEIAWLHTRQSDTVREVWQLCDTGRAKVQALTIKFERHLTRLRRLDRAIARCEKGSKNRAKLLRRRAKLHGKITATRKLFLHELSRRLAGGFDVVCIEDLNVAGMPARKGLRNGRSVAEASMGELIRQLDDKLSDRGGTLVAVGRYYPSTQICSRCETRY